jgi:hypothetical protein
LSLLFTRLHANACVYVYTPYTYDKWIHMNTYTSNCVVYAPRYPCTCFLQRCTRMRMRLENTTDAIVCTGNVLCDPRMSIRPRATQHNVASSSQKQRRYNRCAPSWRSIQTRHTVKAGRGAEARVVDQDAVHIRVVVGRVERLLQVSLVDLHRTVTVSI